MSLKLIRGKILQDFIQLIQRTVWPDLRAISLRYYDPFAHSLRAESDWGCWPHYERPRMVSLEGTLSGCAFKENDLRFVRCIRESHFYTLKDKEKAHKQGFASTVAFPLRWQGRVIGTAQLYFGREVEFNQNMLEVVWQIAALGASEVYAWLCSEAERKTIEAMSFTNPNRALDVFLKQVILLFGLERAVIYLKKNDEVVELVRGYPAKDAHGLGRVFRLKEQLPFLLVVERNGLGEFFGRDDPQLKFIQPLLEKNRMRGVLVAPISVMGEIRAFLVLDQPEGCPSLTDEDREVLQTLVSHASLLLTHYYSDEDKMKARVARVIAGLEHEIFYCLYNAMAAAGANSPTAEHIRRAEKIMREMLALYQGEELEFNHLLISEVVGRAVEEAAKLPLAKDKEVRLDLTHYKDTNHPMVFGNASLLIRAILNLIKNGLEAIKTGESVEIVLLADKNFASIQVSTPSVIEGVDPDHIFDVEVTNKEGPGRGTGLFLVDLIADTHGGQITYETGRGGTTFILQLPFVKSLEIS